LSLFAHVYAYRVDTHRYRRPATQRPLRDVYNTDNSSTGLFVFVTYKEIMVLSLFVCLSAG